MYNHLAIDMMQKGSKKHKIYNPFLLFHHIRVGSALPSPHHLCYNPPMKVLLCAINSQYIHSNPAVYFLKEAAKDYADIEIREYSINDNYPALLYGILAAGAGTVAFSCYIWNIEIVSRLCKDIKSARPDIRIILGGPEVSYGIDHTALSPDDYNYILEGEGERSFPKLLADLQNKEFREPETDLWPEFYTAENLKHFTNRIIYYESSRGCPFKCAYCLSSVCGKVRFLPIERVKANIDTFTKGQVPLVKFTDRTANCNPGRFKEILCHIMSQENCNTTFHFEIGADLLDDEELELLSRMPVGRVQLEAGIQSTNEETLEACVRKTSLEKIFYNLGKIMEFKNINLHGDLIAGLPYEGLERFKKSFNDLYSLRLHQLQLGFLKLLPGAPLNNIVEEHQYVFSAHTPYEVLKNKYISSEELGELKAVEDVLERYYNSGRFTGCLPILEACFDTPYDMYKALADRYRELGLLFGKISLDRQCDILMEFACEHGLGKEFGVTMLTDFFSTNRQDLPPESIREFWQSSRRLKLGPGGRCIDGKIYCFDYERKNPVTGKYSFYILP